MEDEAAAVGDASAELDGVAWAHGLAEAGFADAAVEGRAACGQLVADEDAARLTHHLAQDDAGDDGVAGEVSLEEVLVAAHVVVCDGPFAFHGNIVHQQHRLAVGEEGLDLVSVKHNSMASPPAPLLGGEGSGMRAFLLFVKQLFFYLFYHVVCVVCYFFVAKTDDGVAHSGEVEGSSLVVFFLCCLLVVAAVHFDNQFFAQANEVCDIVSDWVLSSKTDAGYLLPQCVPQYFLIQGHLSPILFGIDLEQGIPVGRCCLAEEWHMGWHSAPLSSQERGRG